jgi:hypothetical protein
MFPNNLICTKVIPHVPVELQHSPSGSLSIMAPAPRIYMSLLNPPQGTVQWVPADAGAIVFEARLLPSPHIVQNFPQAGGVNVFQKPTGGTAIARVQGSPHWNKSTPSATNVQLVAAEEPASSVDAHLAAAARELDALGLKQEAAAVRELLNAICHKAHQRVEEIDAQINKLKAERERLASLPSLPAGARLQLLGTGQ